MKINHPKHSVSYCKSILLCGVLFGSICSAPLSAEEPAPQPAPIALPQNGVTISELTAETMRLSYNQQSKLLTFDHVSHTGKKQISQVKATAGDQTNLDVQNFQRFPGDTPTDWIVMIDNSRSMSIRKNQRCYLDEAVDITTALVNKLAGNDTLSVYLFSQDLTPLGEKCHATNASSRTAMLNKLKNEGRSHTTDIRAKTALWSMALKCVREHTLATPRGRNQALLIITDADDETSTGNAYNDLRNLANARKLHIHSTVLFHRSKNKGYNELVEICTITGGLFKDADRKLNEQAGNTLADAFCDYQRGSFCNFSVNTGTIPENTALNISCQQQDGSAAGSMSLSAEFLASLQPQPEPQPEPPATPEYPETANLLSNVWDRLNALRQQLSALHENESTTPPDYAKIDATCADFRTALTPLKEPLFQLKARLAAELEAVFGTLETPDEASQAQKNRLSAFCANTAITPETLKEKDLLNLLGRENPLPSATAPALAAMLKIMTEAEQRLTALAEAESAQPQLRDTLLSAITAVKDFLPGVLDEAKKIKALTPEEIASGVETWGGRLAGQAHELNRLARLQTFCNDSSITTENITEQNLLTLLGRTAPLPAPPADLPIEWIYWGIGGGALLLIIILVLILRRKKEPEPQQVQPIPPYAMEPIPAVPSEPEPDSIPEQPSEPEAKQKPAAVPELPPVVPAGTPNIPHHAILGILSTGNSSFWLLSRQITIGKDKSNHISIQNNQVSHAHCLLEWQAHGKWEIIDLHSTNGVFAHGRKHASLIVTSPTDFELGPVQLRLIPNPPQF